MNKPTQRFSNRVADYVRYRPDYPAAVIETLARHCGWTSAVDVADLGSGTGLSALGFLDAGHRVFGVEPNAEMRRAAETVLAGRDNFISIDGSAEATTLADRSVDLVIAAQAFHWFDVAAVAAESARILRDGGHRAVQWNLRKTSGSAFLDGYEALLQRFGTDYAAVSERYADPAALARYFGAGGYRQYRFDHAQYFDYDGLKGRLLSSSYTPAPGHPQHQPMLDALRSLFEQSAMEGKVAFEYDTCLFVGTPCRASSNTHLIMTGIGAWCLFSGDPGRRTGYRLSARFTPRGLLFPRLWRERPRAISVSSPARHASRRSGGKSCRLGQLAFDDADGMGEA